MSSENLNLSKKTLPELQELLERQKSLVQNKKLLERLKDKGHSVRRFYDAIQTEINIRRDLQQLQDSLTALTINVEQKHRNLLQEKHVEYVCSKEKPAEDNRYRPHRTLLNNEFKPSPVKSTNKFTEVTSAYEPKLVYEPTKYIPLPESLVIENDQAARVSEQLAKNALNRLYFNLNIEKEDQEDSEQEVFPGENID